VTGAGDPTGAGSRADDVPWQSLDARMIAVDATRLVGSLVPLVLAVLLRNVDAAGVASTLTTLAMIGIISALFDLARWATTSYRVTDARVEVRSGIVTRRHRSMPRDRIRRVDATARVLHRVFGLSVVTLATGEHAGSSDDELKLDAVTTTDAASLRRRLLGAGAVAAGARGPDPAATGTGGPAATAGGTAAADAPASGDPATGAVVPGTVDALPGATATGADVRAAPDAGAAETGAAGAGRHLGHERPDEVLATLRWRWAPYDVLSFWTLAIPAVLLGGALQALNSVGVPLEDIAEDDRVTEVFRDMSLLTGIALAAAAALGVGVVGAFALFIEKWWGYRLVREHGGRLRIRRGFLTSRSISLDEARLRGVEVAEPLLLRAAGGGRLRAVTTGLAGADSSRGAGADALMPPAPRPDVQRVVSAVLVEPEPPTGRTDLHAHPTAARRKRLTRAAAAGVVAWGAVTGLHGAAADGAPPAAWAAAGVITAIAFAYALDAYRNLGYGLADRYLVARRGAFVRRTVALQRAGVVGWTVRRTIFQRQLGLSTVVATTAAGRGSYPLVDVDAGDGLRFADDAVPGLLAPFLVVPGERGDTLPPSAPEP
jgi:putative membrane protein